MVSWSRSLRARMTQAPTVLKRSSTLPSSYWSGVPALKVLGGSESTLGNKKRIVPSSMAISEAVRVNQATAIQLARKKLRRVGPLAAGLGGAGLGGSAGLGGAAAGALGVMAVEAGVAGAGAPAGDGVSLPWGFGSAMRAISLRV